MKSKIAFPKVFKHLSPEQKAIVERELSVCEHKIEDLFLERKSYSPEEELGSSVDEEKAESTGYANTRFLDSVGDVVLPESYILDLYYTNPVVYFNHDTSTIPIGKCTEANVDEYGLKVRTEYNLNTELGRDIYNSVKEDFLRMHSIGYVVLDAAKKGTAEFRRLEAKIMQEYPEYEGGAKRIIKKCLIFEYSLVGIPANFGSTVDSVKSDNDDTSVKVEEEPVAEDQTDQAAQEDQEEAETNEIAADESEVQPDGDVETPEEPDIDRSIAIVSTPEPEEAVSSEIDRNVEVIKKITELTLEQKQAIKQYHIDTKKGKLLRYTVEDIVLGKV